MDRLKILIAEDHELFRKGLRSLLESSSELEICAEAANGQEAIEMAKQLQPDVVLMDISMPLVDGLHATRVIRREVPKSHVLVLSQHDSSQMVSEAHKAGASAYVTKSQVSHCLLAALETVMQGQPFNWNSLSAAPEAICGAADQKLSASPFNSDFPKHGDQHEEN